jgi:hypothetical protein
VYEASSPPGIDLDPHYLRTRGAGGSAPSTDCGVGSAAPFGGGSPFPVQVLFDKVHDFRPLEESKFCHLVAYNAGTNVFRHRLGERETHALLHLLAHPQEAPRDNVLPYETNGYKRSMPENPRFREQRKAAYGDD